MNGAESLVRTLVAGDVTVSFTNPGTSEMHFVAALDRVEGMRCVLCLHETVTTGAADAYYRMLDKPASTLLHTGPGLANALSNLHNTKRARSGVVNIVGDHATYHVKHDAPLTADIRGLAKTMSHWVRSSRSAKTVAQDGADAIVAARSSPGQIATLILPANTAWNEGSGPVGVPKPVARPVAGEAAIKAAASALAGDGETLILLGSLALRAEATTLAAAIAEKTGCRLMAQGAVARMERGAGRAAIERVPYPVDVAVKTLATVRTLILVGAMPPVGFFAYPGKPSIVYPPDARIVTLTTPSEDGTDALRRLADQVGAARLVPKLGERIHAPRPTGPLNPDSIAAVLAYALPDHAIVTDESVTTGRSFFKATHGAAPHDWLQLTGGSIGEGLPLAVGAAVACPDRKVVALQADGSGMYSLQALWTMARERLDVVVCVWANGTYEILKGELLNVGAKNPGRKAHDMLSLGDPALSWVTMARGMGVDGVRVDTAEGFADALKDACARKGPFLIEVAF